MRKYVRGSFHLDFNISDIETYTVNHQKEINKVCDWGNDLLIAVRFGTTKNDEFICEYLVKGNTASYCNGLVSELRAMLKETWKSISIIYKESGEIIE